MPRGGPSKQVERSLVPARYWGGASRLAAVAAVLLVAVSGCAKQSAVPAAHQRHEIVMHKIAFDPAVLTAAPGDTLAWRNQDIVPHTATALDGKWDSGNIPPDSSWQMVVPAGDSLVYHCRYHPNMRGAVAVASGRT
jgi:plastocyanin